MNHMPSNLLFAALSRSIYDVSRFCKDLKYATQYFLSALLVSHYAKGTVFCGVLCLTLACEDRLQCRIFREDTGELNARRGHKSRWFRAEECSNTTKAQYRLASAEIYNMTEWTMELNNILQAAGEAGKISYSCSFDGPANNGTWTAKAIYKDQEVGSGSARGKQDAKEQASEAAMKCLYPAQYASLKRK